MKTGTGKQDFSRRLAAPGAGQGEGLALADGSRVAVVGGGPAGSFFSYFLLRMAARVGLDLHVDIFEPRPFTRQGPTGCNHCGGIISESLVQLLATEGINLPPTVVQRGIDSYVLHMDVGTVRIDTPLHEKRIAAVFRGCGPPGKGPARYESFDNFLLDLALQSGASRVPELVTGIGRGENGRPRPVTSAGGGGDYDLLVVAAGVNSRILKQLQSLGMGYRPPRGVATAICEFHLGAEVIQEYLGTSMHVFLLDLPRLEFAALIPKGDHVTMCMLGERIDKHLVDTFLGSPEVRQCFPPAAGPLASVCQCFPQINIAAAARPFADRMAIIGDSGTTRLFKDGIGAAYRTAKAAATTAIFHGISAQDFQRHYGRACRAIQRDNAIGKLVFAFSRQMQKRRFTRRAVLRMTSREQEEKGSRRHLSTILWDVFTGSAPYREVLERSLRPAFLGGLCRNLAWSTHRSLNGRHRGGG